MKTKQKKHFVKRTNLILNSDRNHVLMALEKIIKKNLPEHQKIIQVSVCIGIKTSSINNVCNEKKNKIFITLSYLVNSHLRF